VNFGLYRCVDFNPASPGSATWTLLGSANAGWPPAGNLVTMGGFDADPSNYGKVYYSTQGEGCVQGYFP